MVVHPMDRHGPFGTVVVDDDAVILVDAGGILKDAGIRVFTAMHAEEALRHCCETDGGISLLFFDVDMQGDVDGFELARRTASRWPRIGVVSPLDADMLRSAIYMRTPPSSPSRSAPRSCATTFSSSSLRR